MKFDSARLIGWLVPILCIVVAGYFVFDGQAKLAAANKDLAAARADEDAAALARDKAEHAHGSERFAAIGADRTEEDVFLNGLRACAANAKVQLTKWTGNLPEPIAPPPPKDGSGGDVKPVDPSLTTVMRIKGSLIVDGSYQGIRMFLNELNSANRLFTFSEMHWSRKENGVELSANVNRYVDPTLSTTDMKPTTATAPGAATKP